MGTHDKVYDSVELAAIRQALDRAPQTTDRNRGGTSQTARINLRWDFDGFSGGVTTATRIRGRPVRRGRMY